MRILLVEDNQADARLFAELLSEIPDRSFTLTRVDTLEAALRVTGERVLLRATSGGRQGSPAPSDLRSSPNCSATAIPFLRSPGQTRPNGP